MMTEQKEFEKVYLKGFRHGLKKWDDVYFPNRVINLNICKSFQIKEDDTFVVGYPKSGTTWIEEIVWLIKNNLDFEKARTLHHFYRVIVFENEAANTPFCQRDTPRIFKSHLPLQFLPFNIEKKVKLIYVVRNPKDVLVSAFYFFKKMNTENFDGNFNDFFNYFIEGKIWYGSWWKHVDTYLNVPEVHVIYYEDILKNPFLMIKKLGDFLGKNLSEEEIHAIKNYTTFDKMKNNPTMDFTKLVEFEKDCVYFRNGKAGSWRHHFTDEMSRKFDEIIENHNQIHRIYNLKEG